MELNKYQDLIAQIYLKKDKKRGIPKTFVWFCEEVGELARGIRTGDTEKMEEEFADVLAWLTTLATLCGIDMEKAARKYQNGCPKCGKMVCVCKKSG